VSLVDGLIVQWVAVSVAVSLLIKHIDHVAATWTTTEPGAELGTTKSHGVNRHCRKGIRVRVDAAASDGLRQTRGPQPVHFSRALEPWLVHGPPNRATRVGCRRRGGQPRRAVLGMISAHLCVVPITSPRSSSVGGHVQQGIFDHHPSTFGGKSSSIPGSPPSADRSSLLVPQPRLADTAVTVAMLVPTTAAGRRR
jgi:hypothetical protein